METVRDFEREGRASHAIPSALSDDALIFEHRRLLNEQREFHPRDDARQLAFNKYRTMLVALELCERDDDAYSRA